ncbi:hypothetical protein VNI00_004397 [Paramarasmius palmivorus]|uniref:Uncharacterized protein n=1 Tax=Paramarasmius palmivorus TaxID=297713 RepID=A0AAW0DKE7_9AGAR
MEEFLPPLNSPNSWGSVSIGGFLDAQESFQKFTLSYLPLFKFTNTPLYLYWGEDAEYTTRYLPVILRELAPNSSTLAALRASRVPTTAAPVNIMELVPVVHGSGQSNREDMKSFFERRGRMRKAALERETLELRAAREAREANALYYQCPGRKGARVYTWEKEGIHWIRVPVGRNNYDSVWGEYSDNQKRFDSIMNEWDLCENFGADDYTSADSDTESIDMADMEGGPFVDPQHFPEDHEMLVPVEGPEAATGKSADQRHSLVGSVDEDLEEGELSPLEVFEHELQVQASQSVLLELFQREDTTGRYTVQETVQEVAYFRYGFQVERQQLDRQVLYSMSLPWIKVHKILGFPTAEATEDVQDELGYFVSYILRTAPSDLSASFELFDLSRGLPYPRGIERVGVNNELFLLSSSLSPFAVVVHDALTVLEAWRRGWDLEPVKLAAMLLQRGYKFRTVVAGRPGSSLATGERGYAQLGFRSYLHRFDTTDYYAYLYHRDMFLRSPRGRAVALRGGILARLARDIVSAEDVVRGPSEQVSASHDIGECIYYDNGQFWWDDTLSVDEENLICGTYDVESGKCINPS